MAELETENEELSYPEEAEPTTPASQPVDQDSLTEEELRVLRELQITDNQLLMKIKNRQGYYQDMFQEMLLESYDMQVSWENVKVGYTQSLLNNGVKMDPQGSYQVIELIARRMAKHMMVKRMILGLGLVDKYDEIMERELDVTYIRPQTPNTPKPSGDRTHFSADGNRKEVK